MPIELSVASVNVQSHIDELQTAIKTLSDRRSGNLDDCSDVESEPQLQEQICLLGRRLADEYLSQYAWSLQTDPKEQGAVIAALREALSHLKEGDPYHSAVTGKLRDVEDPQRFLTELKRV